MVKIHKTEAEWRDSLDPETYRVTREAGTERPFSHPGFPKSAGSFKCACCGAELFTQETKYESHCGWPAFYATKEGAPVAETRDLSHGMVRVEVHCDDCGAHLGHVFPDGPQDKTGMRYCINGVSIRFEPTEGAEG
ncbi:peptide-methionine (R)-S-oxide reductase MsrB [Celeribacter baekdonensis]|jgi:peptide-methionine (R)-S-oxide reductase|uniref:peptide-methionine (R)-S-oxide reductase n=1 Tax=Celeribacter baekdonensis TaxID=875171 RepID=A0A2R4M1Y3_9RHOB|nr:peptide-methionine (R)-S-oxide reductase MsrB [Celeribacter baekdonensis]AVW91173.1 peptide-methionine (R)-S-oxide reductase [Celeribacter baekdonensis]